MTNTERDHAAKSLEIASSALDILLQMPTPADPVADFVCWTKTFLCEKGDEKDRFAQAAVMAAAFVVDKLF